MERYHTCSSIQRFTHVHAMLSSFGTNSVGIYRCWVFLTAVLCVVQAAERRLGAALLGCGVVWLWLWRWRRNQSSSLSFIGLVCLHVSYHMYLGTQLLLMLREVSIAHRTRVGKAGRGECNTTTVLLYPEHKTSMFVSISLIVVQQ